MLVKFVAAVTLLAQTAQCAAAVASGYKNMAYYAFWYYSGTLAF